ncbi:MAG: FAD:protein FMN transferase, partial [Chloroflexi bacterium]|nr:FAD:protein FMN transferase [Chloroflexota bacterium]
KTGGAFDVTVGPYVRLWRRARRGKTMPLERLLTEAKTSVGYRHLRLDEHRRTVQLTRAKMRLDLGGIAKGYAADEALAVLKRHGITRALVDAGGDIALGAAPPDRKGGKIGVAPLAGADGKPRANHVPQSAQEFPIVCVIGVIIVEKIAGFLGVWSQVKSRGNMDEVALSTEEEFSSAQFL